MVQAFNNQHTVNQTTVCEDVLKAEGNDNIIHILETGAASFHHFGYANFQNCHYWAILVIFIRNLNILRRLLFGVLQHILVGLVPMS
jgi:hypothetical protein